MSYFVREEDPGGHAGEDHDEEGEELEPAGHDAGALGVGHVPGGQGTLHYHLARAAYTKLFRQANRV